MDNDVISRRAAIEHFERTIRASDRHSKYNEGFIDGLEFCVNYLSALSSIVPKQKKGQWIDCEDGNKHCSECNAILEKSDAFWHNCYFCYHCGSPMELFR